MVLKFEPWGDDPEFDWDEDNESKFWNHGIRDFEVEECFENEHFAIPHKKYKDRYIIRGVTDGGRKLVIIIQYIGLNLVRPITGWSE